MDVSIEAVLSRTSRYLLGPVEDLDLALVVRTSGPAAKPAEVQSFALTQSDGRRQLTFRRTNDPDVADFEPSSVPVDSLHAWNQLIGSILGTGLAPGSFSGFFVATAPAEDLMRLSSGGYASAVVGADGIERQAGFVPVSAAAFAPLLVFQILSLVTGQYFLNQISARLQSIEDTLSELSHLLHSEKIGELMQAECRVRSLLEKKYVAPEDLVEIRDLSNQVGAIAFSI